MRPERIRDAGLLATLALSVAMTTPDVARATPQFARQHDAACSTCHLLPPALNETGLSFQASGYLAPAHVRERLASRERSHTIPMAAWITARYEDQGGGGASDLHLPKVELISGGRIGESWSYFAEWRIVSLSLAGDGSLGDRGGRFEDLFVERSIGERHSMRLGQFRSLQQVDVSLRLSASEPLLFNPGLRTGSHADPRRDALDRFSPAARSPAIAWGFRSRTGEKAADGLFHQISVPFVGELSIPLSDEASERASFELHGPPKGVFLETFHRRGLRSLGVHAFVADESWLATALATHDWRNLLLTGGVGYDSEEGREGRWRSSVQGEYFVTGRDELRWAPGVRIEDVSDDGRRPDLVPFLALSTPGTRHTFLLQVEYRVQEGDDRLFIDLSALF